MQLIDGNYCNVDNKGGTLFYLKKLSMKRSDIRWTYYINMDVNK